jgi:hypothetical protein
MTSIRDRSVCMTMGVCATGYALEGSQVAFGSAARRTGKLGNLQLSD